MSHTKEFSGAIFSVDRYWKSALETRTEQKPPNYSNMQFLLNPRPSHHKNLDADDIGDIWKLKDPPGICGW